MINENKAHRKQAHNLRIFHICLIIIGITVTGILGMKIIPKRIYEKNYNLALTYLESSNYDAALNCFNSLPYFNADDTSVFYTEYITQLCADNQYSIAYSALAGDIVKKEAMALIDDYTIGDMESLIQYREAEYLEAKGLYVDAYYKFLYLADYQDSSERAQKVLDTRKGDLYNDALANLDKKTKSSIERALTIFQLIPDYEESSKYIDMIRFMNHMCGTYRKTGILDNDATYVIDYYEITRYEGDSKEVSPMKIIESQLYGFFYVTEAPIPLRQQFIFNTDTYKYGAYWRYSDVGYSTDFEELSRISFSTEQIKKPSIGMTKEEVEKSTWGTPKKINKTTYSWGTTEQWVYDNFRYIYFRNGTVSAIQE